MRLEALWIEASLGVGLSTLAVEVACTAPEQGPAQCDVMLDDCEDPTSPDQGDQGDPTASTADADDGGRDPADDDGNDNSGLPCDVQAVLAEHCWMCHGDPPSFGAPMALTGFDDLQVPAPSDPSQPVHALVGVRLQDDERPMPPNGQITAQERQILLDWIAAGAPGNEGEACDAPPGEPTGPVGPDELPCEPSVTMTAHAYGDAELPFVVPAQGADDLYMCYAFASPFAEGEQATAWAPIIDDERVIHHWILYRQTEPHPDGSVFPCDTSLQITAEFVTGWAPGGQNAVLPDDVGLELGGSDTTYVLQVHYNNVAHYSDAFDRSGVAFCTTETPREQTAGILTVGSVGIEIPPGAEDHPEEGVCGFLETFGWPTALHLLSTSPHMHQLGREFYTDLERLDGTVQRITDVPTFDFESQVDYPLAAPVIVNPGDSLRTTCVYDNPHDVVVGFGEGTADEMCFNFITAYPIDRIDNRNCGIIF